MGFSCISSTTGVSETTVAFVAQRYSPRRTCMYVKGYVKVETEFHVHATEVVELIHHLKYTRVTSAQTACFSLCEINTH